MAPPPRPEAELASLYRRLARRLVSLAAAARTPGRRRFLAGQVRELAEMTMELGEQQRNWVLQNVPAQYIRAARQAQFTLEEGGLPVLESRFTGADRIASRALANRVSTDLSNVRDALMVGLQLQDPREAAGAIESALEGDNRLVRLDGGRVAVLTPDGRFWRPEAYSRLLARTAIADARRVAFRQRYLSNGVDVVRVVRNGTTHDVCRRWEDVTLSLTGETAGMPTVADARAAGLWHPNCAHRYVVDVDRPQPGVPLGGLDVPAPEQPRPILGARPRVPRSQLPQPILPVGENVSA